VRQFNKYQKSAEVPGFACVSGGFGNQLNGIKASIVLSLATGTPLVEITSGYHYNLFFNLIHSLERRITASSLCPTSARMLAGSEFKNISGLLSRLPKHIQFSGRPEYMWFLKSLKMKISEYELMCLMRNTIRISEKFSEELAEFIDSSSLAEICSGKIVSLISIHIRTGDSSLISESTVKKYRFEKNYALNKLYPINKVDKVFKYALENQSDLTKTIFFLATDSRKVKKKFKVFFRDLNHITQVGNPRHFRLQNQNSLFMSAIDIALLSSGDKLISTGSSYAEAAHLLQLNPRQEMFIVKHK